MKGIGLKKMGIILKPTKNDFEKKAVLNPGVYQDGNQVHIFYRAIDDKDISTIGYARLDGPTKVVERWDKPFMNRSFSYEKKGVEDPRITKIDDVFYFTYVAYDGKNAVTCLASGKDLFKVRKKGIITPQMKYDKVGDLLESQKIKERYFLFESHLQELFGKDVLLWDKDVFIFPKKIRGKYAMGHRILPDIQLVYFDNFKELKTKSFWKSYLKEMSKLVILENRYWFESRNVGGGTPPIEVPEGWLLIYHGVEELNKERIYHATAAILDKKNPQKVLYRLDKPLFSPEERWEKSGYVNNVVFPTGLAVFKDSLYIYYGAADNSIAIAKVSLKRLRKELKKQKFYK
jgi:beta-1,2-mannobiose phosphorylase / 1,2-beta-oligomannan phosphorylase